RLTETVRYSGSPLPYSFSERSHRKRSWLVELGKDGVAGVEGVDAPVHRPLAALRGRLHELLADPALEKHRSSFCQVTLTDEQRPRDPMERLRVRFPHTLTLSFEPVGRVREQAGYAERVRGLDDLEMCCSFLDHVRGATADDAERALLAGALEAARVAEGEPAPKVHTNWQERRLLEEGVA
ncbi:MAG: exonuclease SbcCD subunit D C-terminal domain-containing protein, partial [Actinomycetes bacterium]